ncbi:ROK family protein [Pararhizobium mangrovi]|uniref:ROK family protein n=1 Tax=Pararhizobium mangrovi TaxID=2590452 RepID=UPI0022A7EE44|nr:ROK family protein [Pararhizobium mangrovi]
MRGRRRAATTGAAQEGRTPVVLAIDVGGSHIKAMVSTVVGEKRRIETGKHMSAERMVAAIRELTADWEYDAVSVGYPGAVADNAPALEPHNLAPGWKGFDFSEAFGKPTRVVNDAMMQAIGSYQGGRMLFLGLGTGLGSAMIVENVCVPMELAHLPYKRRKTFEDFVGERGRKLRGTKKWRKSVARVVERLSLALEPHEIVLGGGNVKKLKAMPPLCRAGENENAFLGGFRVWTDESLKL